MWTSQPQSNNPAQEPAAVWQHNPCCRQICSASQQAREADSAPNCCCCGQTAVGAPKEFVVALAESMKSLLFLVLVKNLRSQTQSNIPPGQTIYIFFNMALYETDKIRY